MIDSTRRNITRFWGATDRIRRQQCNHTHTSQNKTVANNSHIITYTLYIEALIIIIYYIIISVEYQYVSVTTLTSSTARVPSASPANTAEPTEEGWRHNTLSWRCRHHNFSLQHIYMVMEVSTPQLLPTTHLHGHGGVNITTPPTTLLHYHGCVDTTSSSYNTFTLSWMCQHHNSPPTTHLHYHGCVDTTCYSYNTFTLSWMC